MNRGSKLRVVVLLGCFGFAVAADRNYQAADPVWQKEFEYGKFSCIPQLLSINENGNIILVGVILNQRDKEASGRIWQWTLDKNTGERISDITLKGAKPKECPAITSFWPTKGLDIIDGNEIQLFADYVENNKQGIVRIEDGHAIQKHKTKTQANEGDFVAGRMRRINANEYFIFGADYKQNGVLQKRNNRGDVIWEKQYHYGMYNLVSGIDKIKSTEQIAIAGLSLEDTDIMRSKAWVNIITDDGNTIMRTEFDDTLFNPIEVPLLVVLDNKNIAVVYKGEIEGQNTSIKYRVYSTDLELICRNSVAIYNKIDSINYGIAAINGGFVVVHDVWELGVQNRILNQYDYDGKRIRAIKIDGVGGLGGDQVLVESKGNMVYIASMKSPVLPPVRTVITALDLGEK